MHCNYKLVNSIFGGVGVHRDDIPFKRIDSGECTSANVTRHIVIIIFTFGQLNLSAAPRCVHVVVGPDISTIILPKLARYGKMLYGLTVNT